jgi:hypothetical protein
MRDFKIYISVASILLIIYLAAQYNKPSPINWQPTLYYQDKIPFGTNILHNELPHFFPGATVINTNKTLYEQLKNDTTSGSNYLVISKTVNLSKIDYSAMVKFISLGNTVFISAFNWQGTLADTLKLMTGQEFKKKNVWLNFTNSKLSQANGYHFDKDISNEYFDSFDTLHAVSLGKNEDGHSNFLSFKYGKGTLYLCTNPLLFTNYGLLTNHGDDYAAKALSYFPKTETLFWDEYQNGDIPDDPSPMRVFFSYASLQWAYYISLVSLVIFILYEKKRRQRIIPVIEPLKNSTVDFAKVVGQVYYEQRNNMNIAQKKIVFFLEHLRTKYYLKTTLLDMEFIRLLSQKTGTTYSFALEVVNHINYVSVQKQITDGELIKLNRLIEQFYNQSK